MTKEFKIAGITEAQELEFERLARPLSDFLGENFPSGVSVMLTGRNARLMVPSLSAKLQEVISKAHQEIDSNKGGQGG